MSGSSRGPRRHDGRLSAAIARHKAGDLRAAERIYRELLSHDPDHAEVNHLLGLVKSQEGDYGEAIRLFQRAAAGDGGNATYQCNLGEALRRAGDLAGAEAAFRRAIALAPDFADAHYSLGNVLKAQDRLDEAVDAYKAALRLQPGHVKAFYNLGNTFLSQGLFGSAQSCYEAAVALDPNHAEAHNNLGVAFKELERTEDAIAEFQEAIALRPAGYAEAQRNLGQAREKQGRVEEARRSYEAVVALEPEDPLFRLSTETICPVIPESSEAIEAYWRHLDATLTYYLERDLPLTLEHLHKLDGIPPSLTVYHGRDERDYKARWAALFAGCFAERGAGGLIRRSEDPPQAAMARDGRPHIGFVVTHGHEGVFLKCMRGILNHLSGERFRLTVLCSRQAGPKILAPAISNPAVRFLPLSNDLLQAAEQVRAAEFDLLHYWEVGTDGMNYYLPFFGLAPVQCATWGWPVTTGIPRIGHYLSCELLETGESDDFYTEKLVRLRHLPTYYYRPPVPATPRSRAELGFGQHEHLYLCVQNLRKVQPDFDDLIGAILREDPQGRALFIEDAQAGVTELLRQRFERGLPDEARRIRFVPRMRETDYLNLVAVADVVLDTTHFGGGANTTYDALALGTPIVTLPGRFHRGRWADAAYQRIGVTDGIAGTAEDYVAIALRLAGDADQRRELGARIAAASPVLFEDMGAVEELAGFFAVAVGGG